MIIIEAWNDYSIWRWRAVLVVGAERVELTRSHEEDHFYDEDTARSAGEAIVALHLKEIWRMS